MLILAVLEATVDGEGASEAVVQKNVPPLQIALQRFVFSSSGNRTERLREKKGMIVLQGATGLL